MKRLILPGMNPTAKKKTPWLAAAAVSQILALVDHGYLALRHYKLKTAFPEPDAFCHIGSAFNCDAVGTSAYAVVMGLPLALWGWTTNLALLAFILLRLFGARSGAATSRHALWLSAFVLGMSFVMGGISLFLLNHYCLYCLVAYALSLLTFACLYAATPAPRFFPAGASLRESVGPAWPTVPLLLLIPTLAFSGDKSLQKIYAAEHVETMVTGVLETWRANPERSFSRDGGLVRPANKDVPALTITEFADFRCGHCRNAAAPIDTFIKSHPDVRFVFRLFPLDGTCNPHVQHKNGASCFLAKAAYCADEQGKGWEAHDWLFGHQDDFRSLPAVEGAVNEMAAELALDPAALRTCAASDRFDAVIKTHADEATRAGVEGTPAIFADGRLLPVGFALPVLQGVYEAAAAEKK